MYVWSPSRSRWRLSHACEGVQGRSLVLIDGVDVGAALQQRHADLLVAILGSVVQGRVLVTWSALRRPALQQRLAMAVVGLSYRWVGLDSGPREGPFGKVAMR